MRSLPRRVLAALTILLLSAAVALGDFITTENPVHPNGTRATIDLPGDQHMRNIGGSDGAGLCVGTSNEVVGHWQSVPELDGFQAWLHRRPGGSYPEQLERDLKLFCGSKGVAVPPHIQHTGGDIEFLRAAFATRRAVGMTYGGHDPFYGSRTTIAHMVTGAHLDGKLGAIIDNNEPKHWRWMDDGQLVNRWLGRNDDGSMMRDRLGRTVGGGWAVVWLAAPPPPVDTTSPHYLPERAIVKPVEANDEQDRDNLGLPFPDDAKIGPELENNDNLFPNGFDPEQLKPKMQYWINGEPADRVKCLEHLRKFTAGLDDDSKRAFVSVVSDDKEVAALVRDAAKPYADKLHVQVFKTASWVARDRLSSAKLIAQLPATQNGKTVYRSDDVTKDTVTAACKAALGIVDPPPAPPVQPTPPSNPDPIPAPDVPTPSGPQPKLPAWLVALLTALGFYVYRSRTQTRSSK